MNITRIEHVAIALRDPEEGRRAFGDLLGLPLTLEEDYPEYGASMAMYTVGETSVEILHGPAETPIVGKWLSEGSGLFHVCFEVDDIRAAIDELCARGARMLESELREGHGGSLVAFVDPACTAGVLVELVELVEH